MKCRFILFITCLVISARSSSQTFEIPAAAFTNGDVLSRYMPTLAEKIIKVSGGQSTGNQLNDLFRLQILAGDFAAAVSTIASLRKIDSSNGVRSSQQEFIQYELYAKAKARSGVTGEGFAREFSPIFSEVFQRLDDQTALQVYSAFLTRGGVDGLRANLDATIAKLRGKDSLDLDGAASLCQDYFIWQVYKEMEPIAVGLLKDDDDRRYLIQDSILIKTKDGGSLSAIVIRKRSVTSPQPAALVFTIYAQANKLDNEYQAKFAAAQGYVGVIGFTRGKLFSLDAVVPYEKDGNDVNEIIDWIIKQHWSDGRVGMYGGSYNGFTQWAATKHLNSALKTIVPYVAAIPGLGLPMENNVFLTANYGWPFYVTDNKYLDDKIYNDPGRWDSLLARWYRCGVSFRKIDSIDGAPNPWLQRWLQHPSFDEYWQSMVPCKEDFSKINIPVLTFTGYYDDGQISALHYLREHYKYNKNADHYLVIGPYDHFGAQRGGEPILRGYSVDPVALIDTRKITFEWFDYVFRNGLKPAILKDKVNFEVMGANEWRHASSLSKMANDDLTLYLSDQKNANHYSLAREKPNNRGFLVQQIDLADRTSSTNKDYYPFPIVLDSLNITSELLFVSDPVNEPISMDGSFSGNLKISINKQDVDIGMTLYELLPNGKYFHLAYFLGRASYAADMSARHLLTPGKKESIPFERSRLVCRQLEKGSRLALLLTVNKNSDAQVNYGTGKDVSDETSADGKQPLIVKWYNDSFIKIPIWKN